MHPALLPWLHTEWMTFMFHVCTMCFKCMYMIPKTVLIIVHTCASVNTGSSTCKFAKLFFRANVNVETGLMGSKRESMVGSFTTNIPLQGICSVT